MTSSPLLPCRRLPSRTLLRSSSVGSRRSFSFRLSLHPLPLCYLSLYLDLSYRASYINRPNAPPIWQCSITKVFLYMSCVLSFFCLSTYSFSLSVYQSLCLCLSLLPCRRRPSRRLLRSGSVRSRRARSPRRSPSRAQSPNLQMYFM